MPIPWTLQRYIVREMSKTFFLTALGLTAVIGLGGGVLNMVKLGGEVSPSQLLNLLWLVLPIATALTLPMAALFSVTTAYGRLGGDNEFVACRASGINLHVLLIPSMVLGLLVAGTTFLFSNAVIPRLIRELERLATADIATLVQERLNRPRGITWGTKDDRVHLDADEAEVDPSQPNAVILHRVAFAEVKNENWHRFGTAREVHLSFETVEQEMRVLAQMFNATTYDPVQGRFVEVDKLALAQRVVQGVFSMQIKFLTLSELFYFRSHPGEWGDVKNAMNHLRRDVARYLTLDRYWSDWEKAEAIRLQDKSDELRLTARSAKRVAGGDGIDFSGVTIDKKTGSRTDRITAEMGTLEWVKGDAPEQSGVRLDLVSVSRTDGQARRNRDRETLGPFVFSSQMVDMVNRMSDQELLDVSSQAASDDPLSRAREHASQVLGSVTRRMTSSIHERAAFSVSILALVILGAVAAIVLRGSHLVTAFGIAFVPSAFIITTIVTGKQLSNNVGTHFLGLLLMWGGIVFVALVDGWSLTRVLRR